MPCNLCHRSLPEFFNTAVKDAQKTDQLLADWLGGTFLEAMQGHLAESKFFKFPKLGEAVIGIRDRHFHLFQDPDDPTVKYCELMVGRLTRLLFEKLNRPAKQRYYVTSPGGFGKSYALYACVGAWRMMRDQRVRVTYIRDIGRWVRRLYSTRYLLQVLCETFQDDHFGGPPHRPKPLSEENEVSSIVAWSNYVMECFDTEEKNNRFLLLKKKLDEFVEKEQIRWYTVFDGEELAWFPDIFDRHFKMMLVDGLSDHVSFLGLV